MRIKGDINCATKAYSVMLPLLEDEMASHAMVRHTMDIIEKVHTHLKPNQPLIINADQPVYALSKQVQWLYPHKYGDHSIFMMMGPLHIEMTFLNTIGDWLESSGWVEILVQGDISTPGRADSFLKGNHPKRSRYAHQITCASLSILMQEAYRKSNDNSDLSSWIADSKEKFVQFRYWSTVLEMETLLFAFVKSIRTSNFKLFLSCLERIAPWMFAMDHMHYPRWLPVFINDLKRLPVNHPNVYKEFLFGKFTINKTGKPFSNIGIDQAHEQNNKLVKTDGDAVDILLNDNTALMKWMVAGPEIAEMVEAFRSENVHERTLKHHEDSNAFEKQFRKDVKALCNVFEVHGNPFDDPDDNLVHLISKMIMNEEAVDSVKRVKDLGERQFRQYVEKRLIKCEVPIHEKIEKNKLVLFRAKNKVCSSKGKMKAVSLKQEKNLYASLFVACQLRDCNLTEFFEHENHSYPPSISEYGKIRKASKSDFLSCLQEYGSSLFTSPAVTAKVIDGAAAVQCLKPSAAKTFGEYASNEFKLQYLSPSLEETLITCVDVGFLTDTFLFA